MIVLIAYAVAVAAVLALGQYVFRRYPRAPKRVPMRIRIDGRPGPLAGRRILWLPPAVLMAVVTIFGALLAFDPPRDDLRAALAVVFVIVAEVAWFVAWTTDRQIELGRGMTYRIAPTRLLVAFSPIALSVVAALVLAIEAR